MSRIDDLIAECCPSGVEYMTLGQLISYEQPGKYLVESTDYDDAFDTPVLTAGQTFILGYTDERTGIYPANKSSPVIIFDDFTTAFKWVDFPFKAKSSAMKMLTTKHGAPVGLRFVYFAMLCIDFEMQDHARHWISKFSAFRIPVPPIEVQREIVRVLDLFTTLEAELEAELEARRAQYTYYRDALLTFDLPTSDAEGTATRWSQLGAVVNFTNAKAHERLVDPEGNVALLTSRFISTQGRSARYIRAEDVLTPARKDDVALVMSDLPNGRALARAFMVDADNRYAANQRVCLISARNKQELLPKYLFYQVDRNPQLLAYDSGVDQTHLKKDWILKIMIPVPSLEEQDRIVSILDRFDALVNDISIGLPAELAARRKQYEHYRDRLLTFEEIPT